ncbi:alpha/beta fold hydrolase [Ramlibacter rhizophilus]|uniref:Alpha/beta hydrolase n=1 Tax=Ramlibacter rhizophilus TaxID=1781167 RepID=A0A4Z0BKG3_9BURK|nr:alpha/beta hydrolase [Ramlibacter rhizophilus]TFY99802.1 alpha/beta hydrolase [Ramlibacter rhizophilus]
MKTTTSKTLRRPAFLLSGLLAATAAAATAWWVHRKAIRADADHPPQGKIIVIDGVQLHYVSRGEGSPVVLLHGNAVTHADFEASGLIDRLARDHLVIAFDRPGFGHSSRPRDRLWTPTAQAALVRRALAKLGIDKAVVVGHSMGAMVAAAFGLDHPSAVRGLVLVSGYYYPEIRFDALATAPVAVPVIGDVMRYTVTALAARTLIGPMVKGMFAPAAVPSGFFTTVPRETMVRPGQLRGNAEDAAFMIPQARTLSSRYSQLRVPVTIVAGADDQIVDLEAHSRRLHLDLVDSTLIVVPGVGHMVHYAAQEEIAAAIASYETLSPGRPAPLPAQPLPALETA